MRKFLLIYCYENLKMAQEEFIVHHNDVKYDISGFLKNHPGGYNYMEGSKNKDITSKMLKSEHSKSAFYLLREYKLGGRDEQSFPKDEDLEELVNWNKPMLFQVANLGAKYNEWVISPVDRELRLFKNPLLEYLTITPWYVVPIVWIPIILVLTHRGYVQLTESTQTISILPTVLCLIVGIITWTLLEYSLHRWIFHMEPTGSSRALIYIHFAIHGLHHKVPFDTRRLVFPPVPAAVLAYAAHILCKIIFPTSTVLLITAGGLIGYLMYDMIHFYLHYGAPKEGSYLYTMKRYHNQHHFVHHNDGFGISNMYWDQLFGTKINLKKLNLAIKWCTNKTKIS